MFHKFNAEDNFTTRITHLYRDTEKHNYFCDELNSIEFHYLSIYKCDSIVNKSVMHFDHVLGKSQF